MLDPKEVAEALEKVASYIDRHRPRGDDAERMTFRQFHEITTQMEWKLGATHEVVEKYRDHPLVHAAIESVGMALDDNGLLPIEKHEWDFPIAFQRMPEYQPLIEAVDRLWETIGDASEPTEEQWAELVRRYKPPVKLTVV